MAALVRGSTIFFSATVLDQNGAPVTPSSANLYLTYAAISTGMRAKVTVPMVVAGNVVSATWESLAAVDGIVHWSIRATGSNTFVQDGQISLTANEANPTS